MKLPSFRFASRSDRSVADGLDRLVERLDRLIAVGERTNQLLEQLHPQDVPAAPEAGEVDQPLVARVAEATPRPAQTPSTTRRRKRRQTPVKEPPHVAAEGPRRLHQAIIQVLVDAGEPLTANDIAGRIRERNLFEPPRSGHELRGGQVSARVGNATYRDRFVRRDGRIWLADPDGERLGRTEP